MLTNIEKCNNYGNLGDQSFTVTRCVLSNLDVRNTRSLSFKNLNRKLLSKRKQQTASDFSNTSSRILPRKCSEKGDQSKPKRDVNDGNPSSLPNVSLNASKSQKKSLSKKAQQKKVVTRVSPFKLCKVFHSQRQNDNLQGVPCVPPPTPSYSRDNKHIVPALSDVKSRRQILNELKKMESCQLQQIEELKKKAEAVEKRNNKRNTTELKIKQRQMIYEMNRYMTELENAQFEEYKRLHQGAPV